MIATSTLLAQGGLAPRLLALAGYAIAAVRLILVATITWIELLFPAWVALVRLHILRRGHLYTPPTAATQPTPCLAHRDRRSARGQSREWIT